MNYADMSDFEINKAVFFKSKIDYEDYNPLCPTNGSAFDYADGANWHEFDPCNNPSDAWPIIVANGICITSPVMDGERWRAVIYNSDENYSWSDKNPLRAAMIVFLMMNED